jgi:hypothetical protein
VAEALATLPWVEPDSIKAVRATRQAKFTVKDRNQFDLEQVRSVVSKAGYPSTKLLTGPTEK